MVVIFLFIPFLCLNCDSTEKEVVSVSGVTKMRVNVPVDAEGLTVEQHNIQDRYAADNEPGSIKHVYVISAYSGQVILYSTAKGKVTSSSKRANPYTVACMDGESVWAKHQGLPVIIKGDTYMTPEVLQDDGTYGSSAEYIYWWDTKGIYHQHYISGGQIVHVSSQPMPVKNIIINIETGG
jgi:hypothetical protein